MRHDWILDVLADLEAYASQNDLPGFTRKVAEAIAELRHEAGLTEGQGAPGPRRPRPVN